MRVFFWVALASGPGAVGLWWLAGLNPGLVETLYSRGLYPLVMGPWSRLVAAAPFAVAPVLALLLVLFFLTAFFLWGPARALLGGAAGVSVLLAWFILGWGLNFQRPSWAETQGLTASGATVAALEDLADRISERTSTLRTALWASGKPDWSDPGLRGAVTAAYARVGAAEPLLGGRWADPKVFPVSEALSWLGIAGIFIPHTGEPLVNAGPADWQLPFTAAHEAAHLRGWSREDEANFLAFWVLRDDPDPRLAYSAWASALLYTASALEGAGPDGGAAWARVAARTDPGILADWRQMFAYWKRFQGPARELAQTVNDVYLKSQGQADGVRSYGRMVDLLLATLLTR